MVTNRSFANLRQAIAASNSLLRAHLDTRYPNQKDIYRRYRVGVGPILVAPGTANAGTLGTAFDWLVRFMVSAHPSLDLATRGIVGARSNGLLRAFHELALTLGATSDQLNLGGIARVGRYIGPAAILSEDEELACRAMWVLALLTEVYRAGLMANSPIYELRLERVSVDSLLALAPDDAVQQLKDLKKLAEESLLPSLRRRPNEWALGPTFDGSKLLKADADLIAGGALVDLKTSAGSRRTDGTRYASVKREELWQILCYALMDFSDSYGITEIGLYAARYGSLTMWPLTAFLSELRGSSVDLAEERVALAKVLRRQQGVR
jgi:hypothetical protein